HPGQGPARPAAARPRGGRLPAPHPGRALPARAPLAPRIPAPPARGRPLARGDPARPGLAVRRCVPAEPQRRSVHLDDPQPPRAALLLRARDPARPVSLVGPHPSGPRRPAGAPLADRPVPARVVPAAVRPPPGRWLPGALVPPRP